MNSQGGQKRGLTSNFEKHPEMNPAKTTCIEDLRQIYESRVPRMFYDYCDTGSYTTSTYVDNTRAFEKYKLRQRVARNIDNRSLKTKMVGQDVSMLWPWDLSASAACSMRTGKSKPAAPRRNLACPIR